MIPYNNGEDIFEKMFDLLYQLYCLQLSKKCKGEKSTEIVIILDRLELLIKLSKSSL